MDPYGKVRQSDKVRLAAQFINNAIDATRAERQSRFNQRGPEQVASLYGPTTIRIQNQSGDDLDAFSVVKLDAPIISPTDNLDEWQAKPNLQVLKPASTTDLFAVLQEAVPADELGRAVVAGATPVQVHLTDTGHAFATPTAADATQLTSSTSGSALILWTDRTSTGTKWALVYLGVPPTQPTETECVAAGTANVASLNGSTTIDGVSLGFGARVLLTGQTAPAENGPWVIGSPWTRPPEYASGSLIQPGFLARIAAGATYAETFWFLNGAGAITVDTSNTTWDLYGVPRYAVCLAAADFNVASLSGTTTIDVVGVGVGDRVLLTAQSTASENGPWIVQSGAWKRPLEYAPGSIVAAGFVAFVAAGDVYAETEWRLRGVAAVTVDTTATTWDPLIASLTQQGIITTDDQIVGAGRKQFQAVIVDQGASAISSAYLPGDGLNVNAGPGGNLIQFHLGATTANNTYAQLRMSQTTDGLGAGGTEQTLFLEVGQIGFVGGWLTLAENGYLALFSGAGGTSGGFAMAGNPGAWGTDTVGNVFMGGICVTVGTGTGTVGFTGTL
jgi:hypothetical protein